MLPSLVKLWCEILCRLGTSVVRTLIDYPVLRWTSMSCIWRIYIGMFDIYICGIVSMAHNCWSINWTVSHHGTYSSCHNAMTELLILRFTQIDYSLYSLLSVRILKLFNVMPTSATCSAVSYQWSWLQLQHFETVSWVRHHNSLIVLKCR